MCIRYFKKKDERNSGRKDFRGSEGFEKNKNYIYTKVNEFAGINQGPL